MHPTSSVLFLCSGNFYRSRFAEACFNFRAARQDVAWTAQSRGFRLSPKNVGPISEHAVAGLQARGIPLPQPYRMPLVATERDLTASNWVIALKEAEHRPLMRMHFPDWVDRVEYWHVDDIDFAKPTLALTVLENAIGDLVARLRGETAS